MNNNKILEKGINNVKKLHHITDELEKKVKMISADSDLEKLGFKCKGRLFKYEGYEEFFERLYVWVKVEDDKIYTVVVVDIGSDYCELVYQDVYIKQIVDEINLDVTA